MEKAFYKFFLCVFVAGAAVGEYEAFVMGEIFYFFKVGVAAYAVEAFVRCAFQ